MGLINLTQQELTAKFGSGGGFTTLAQPTATPQNDVSTWDALSAAFTMDNSVGSFFASDKMNTFNDIEEGYDVFTDITGYEEHAARFIGVRNPVRAQAIKNDITEETTKRQILNDAGWMGIGASVIATVLDPVDWVGAAAGVGVLSKGGKIAKIAAGATGGAIATEGVMQATQQTRTIEESMLNVAAAPLTAAAIVKGSQIALRIAGKGGIPKGMNPDDIGDDIVDGMLSGRNPMAAPASISPKNVNAAQTQMSGFTDDTTLYKEGWSKGSIFEKGKKASKTFGGFQAMMTPIGRMAGSAVSGTREYVHSFLENGLTTKGNVSGQAKEIAAETIINRKQSEYIVASEDIFSKNFTAAKEAGEQMNDGDFAKEVGKAMSNGDVHSNPHVQSTAQEMRKIFDKLKVDAQEVGLLPKELEGVTGAESYFGRVYDRATIRANSDAFRDMLQKEFLAVAEETKARGEANVKLLSETNLKFTEEELISQKISKPKVRKQIESLTPEGFDWTKVDKEQQAMLFEKFQTRFADDKELLEIIDSYRKKMARSKNVKETLTNLLLDIKKSIMDDLTVNTNLDDLRNAAIKTETNILGDGTFTPNTVSYKNVGINDKLASAFKRRALTISDNMLEPYLEKDALFVTRRNIMTMVPQIELMKKQKKLLMDGEKPDLNMTQLKKRIESEYQEKLNLLDKTALVDMIMTGKFNAIDLDATLGKAVADDLRKIITDGYVKAFVDQPNLSPTDPKYKVSKLQRAVKITKKDGSFTFKPREGVDEKEVREALLEFTTEISKKTQKWSKEYIKHRKQDLKDLEATRQLLLGELRYSSDPTSFWNKSLRNLRSVNYMSMLGGVTISSMTDVSRHGMVNGLKGYSNFFNTNNWKGYTKSASKQELARMGVVAEMVLNKRAAEMAELQEGVYEKTKLETAMNKMTNAFSKYTGMSYWTDVQKNIAVGNTQDIILEASEKLRKGIELDQKEIVRFAENGLNTDDLRAIGEQFRKHGETDNGLRLSNSDKWDDFNLAEKYKDVLRKQADMIVISPSVGDKPLWTTSSEFSKSVFQFQQFIFAATNRQVLAGMSYNNKNMLPWMLVQLGVGALVVGMKDAMSGKERKWDDAEAVSSNMLELVDRSGIIPLTSYASKAGVFAGITSRNRYEESQLVGSLLGPSMSTAERIQKITAAGFDGNIGTVMEEGSKLIPFQNHPAVQLIERATDFERKDLRQLN